MASSAVDKYQRITKDLEEVNNKIVKFQTQIDMLQKEKKQIMGGLQKEYKVSSLDDAKALYEGKKKEFEEYVSQIEEKLASAGIKKTEKTGKGGEDIDFEIEG